MIQNNLEQQLNEFLSSRKAQVGSSNRNEKIRTYNYNQDRITDHRIENGTVHNLKSFLTGALELDEMITRIDMSLRKKHLIEEIKNIKDINQ